MTDSPVPIVEANPPTDGVLLDAVARGDDPDAVRQLIGRHEDWVYAVALRGVRDPGLAADCAQATFLLLWRHAPRLAGADDRAVASWLFRTTRNNVSNARRLRQRRDTHERKAAMQRAETNDPSGLNPADREQLVASLDAAIEKLSAADRSVVLLRFFCKQRFGQIALSLRTTEEAARKRLTRAVQQLRRHLASSGFAVAPAALTTALSDTIVAPAPTGLLLAAPTATAQSLAAATFKATWIAGVAVAASVTLALTLVVLTIATLLHWPNTAPPVAGGDAPAVAPIERRTVTGYAGRVLLPDGSPLVGARVTPVNNRSDRSAEPVSTGNDGSFAVEKPEWLEDDILTVLIESETQGLAAAYLRRDFECIIYMRDTARIEIPVFDPAGKPAIGRRVVLVSVLFSHFDLNVLSAYCRLPAEAQQRWSSVVDANGIARIDNVPQGSWVSFKCEDPRLIPKSMHGRGVPFESRFVPVQRVVRARKFELSDAATIQGRIFDQNGQPLGGAKIGAAESDAGIAHSAADGTYTLTGLTGGKYTVGARGLPGALDATAAVSSVQVEVEAGQRATAPDLRVGEGIPITGRVIDPKGKGVIATVGVYAPRDSSSGLLRTFKTDAAGEFAFRVADESAMVYVMEVPKGLRSDTQSKLQLSDDSPDPLTFTLEPIAKRLITIRGVVVDEKGHVVPYAGVSAVQPDSEMFQGRQGAAADAEGRFEFEHLPPNTLLTARGDLAGRPAATVKPVAVQANATDIRLTVTTDAIYSARVLAKPGESVSIMKELPGGYGVGVVDQVLVGEDGAVVIPGLLRDSAYSASTDDGNGNARSSPIRPRDRENEVKVRPGAR